MRNIKVSFWESNQNNILAIISIGRKHYNSFWGNLHSSAPPKKIGVTDSLEHAVKKIKNRIIRLGIPFVVRTSTDEFYNGDHLTLRFEFFDSNGKLIDKFYEAQVGFNKYDYYTLDSGKDVIYSLRVE